MDRSSLLERPLVSRYFLSAWIVLVATLPLGFRAFYRNPRIGLTTWQPGSRMGINYRTYHHAAERALAGEQFYDVPPPDTFEFAVYLYPPGTVPVFYPFTALDWTTGFAVFTALSLAAAGIATALLVDYVESYGPTLGWVDVGLIFGAFVASTHAFGTIYYGNINYFLALAIIAGFWSLRFDHERLAGVAFALAALFKLFPALIGLWLLRRRRWEAVGAAIVTGVGGLVVGVLLFGVGTTRYYLTNVIRGRTDTDLFVGGYPIDGTFYVTIQQPLSHFLWSGWPGATYPVLLILTIIICASILAYFYRDIETETDRQMAILATLVVMVIVLPSLRWYLILVYLPLVTLLYTWNDGPGRFLFIAGGVLFSLTYSTERMVNLAKEIPDPFHDVAFLLTGIAVPSLYGMGLMLAGCAWYKSTKPQTETTDV